MSFLRIGTACVVVNQHGQILLSQRGDLRTWNLPGGRLDVGETLSDGAAREVYEETGVEVEVAPPIGLYYTARWQRLNVIFPARPVGGKLLDRTSETLNNAWFLPGELPEDISPLNQGRIMAALNGKRVLGTYRPAFSEYLKLRWKFGWRWVVNLLRGQPEPRYPRFEISAVGLIWEQAQRRVLTLADGRNLLLPRVRCDGRKAPWELLQDWVRGQCGLAVVFEWAGLWQDTTCDEIELVFVATMPEVALDGSCQWSIAQNAALVGRDADYVERARPGDAQTPVWTAFESQNRAMSIYLL